MPDVLEGPTATAAPPLPSVKAFDLSPEMLLIAESAGTDYGVSDAISEHDFLLGYTINNVGLDPAEAVSNYFLCGKQDADNLVGLIKEYAKTDSEQKILDFASGFGRVTRFLSALLPNNVITACDVHDEACSFIGKNLGINSLRSPLDPHGFSCEPQDFIFAFSLFSHLPDETFGGWVAALYRSLEPDGVLLFTTHGEAARRRDPIFFGKNFDDSAGFGYRLESDQEDLPSSAYGTMVVDMTYVLRQIREHAPGAVIESYRSKCWFGLQDEWIIRRPAGD